MGESMGYRIKGGVSLTRGVFCVSGLTRPALGRPDHCSTHVTPRYSLLYSTVYGLYEHGSYTIVVVAAAGAGALGKPTEARTLAPYLTGLQLT